MTIPAVSAPNPADVIEQFESESRTRKLTGASAHIVTALSLVLAISAALWVGLSFDPFAYRAWFLLLVLALAFLCYPAEPSEVAKPVAADWILAALSCVALVPPLFDREFSHRAAAPTAADIALAALLVALVLEATRRAVGRVLPLTAIGFLLYAYLGPLFDLAGLDLLAHRGYDIPRLAGTLYHTLEGIFGVPLDVASTYIILFALFAAVLERSGAGTFLVDWALAAVGRSGSAAGTARAVTVAGFLLGTVSGSGVATAVTLGSVSWPMLRSAGFAADRGAAILAAAGIGAVLSPPTLGAAAFLIAEFLRIPYLQVLVMAIVPTILYYLGTMLMVEWDDNRTVVPVAAVIRPPRSLGAVSREGWHHFVSLAAIVALLGSGMTAARAVAIATIIAVVLSFRTRELALGPKRLAFAMADGARGIVAIAATTATAGIIVGVMTLTGLGLRIAGLIADLGGGHVLGTVLLSAVAVLLLGLAVPVTASYIIAAVTVAPALTQVGVPVGAAHMFVFYYAVLSEVSPPTALAPFAAAAVTGADPWRATMQTWKYALPAFLVPIAFASAPSGVGILLSGGVGLIALTSITAALGIVAIAAALTGGPGRRLSRVERALAMATGLLFAHPSITADAAGVTLLGVLLAMRLVRVRRVVSL